MKLGAANETDLIKIVLLKHPKEAFINQKNIDSQWQQLGYSGCPDFSQALAEYECFVDLLKGSIADIHYLPRDLTTGLDSIYVRDAALITPQGAILGRMGKRERENEPQAVKEFLELMNIPVIGTIEGHGKLEGGDVIWLNESTMAVGLGYRTNLEGLEQLKKITKNFVNEIIPVPLPHWQGPLEVLHLMSLISPIDKDLAVVYSKLLPVPFRQWLVNKGFILIEVDDQEYQSMAVNILTVAPRKCVMIAGNLRTRQALIKQGVEVWEYQGENISRMGAGGPTCLTRPIYRCR